MESLNKSVATDRQPTCSVEIILAVIPREFFLPGSKHVVQGPSYDHIVVNIADEAHDHHSNSNTCPAQRMINHLTWYLGIGPEYNHKQGLPWNMGEASYAYMGPDPENWPAEISMKNIGMPMKVNMMKYGTKKAPETVKTAIIRQKTVLEIISGALGLTSSILIAHVGETPHISKSHCIS